MGGERLHVVTLTCLCVCVWPTPCLHMQPQENCNADVLIGKFLSEMDAETNEPEEEEEEGEEMAEAEADVDEEMEELADAGIAPASPFLCLHLLSPAWLLVLLGAFSYGCI